MVKIECGRGFSVLVGIATTFLIWLALTLPGYSVKNTGIDGNQGWMQVYYSWRQLDCLNYNPTDNVIFRCPAILYPATWTHYHCDLQKLNCTHMLSTWNVSLGFLVTALSLTLIATAILINRWMNPSQAPRYVLLGNAVGLTSVIFLFIAVVQFATRLPAAFGDLYGTCPEGDTPCTSFMGSKKDHTEHVLLRWFPVGWAAAVVAVFMSCVTCVRTYEPTVENPDSPYVDMPGNLQGDSCAAPVPQSMPMTDAGAHSGTSYFPVGTVRA